MTTETIFVVFIVVLAAFACYYVFEWQKTAIPPYQEPVAPEPDLAEQWVQTTKTDTLDNIDKWNAKVGDKIWYKPDSGALTPAQVAQIKETVVTPQAAWPFPQGPKP